MKSATLVCESPGAVKMAEVELTDPGDNEIQIKTHYSLISPGTERAFALNLENASCQYPMFPGYSTAGVVEKVGKKVSEFELGDRVACFGVGHKSAGNVEASKVVKVPQGVSLASAAFTSLGVIALQGVRKARIELGEATLVIGLGIIGQLAMQLSKINGALPVIAMDRLVNRLTLARMNGAEVIINSTEENWPKQLDRATDGLGPQVVVECTGVPDVINLALDKVGTFGRIILLGSTRGNNTVNFYRDVHKKAVTIVGAHISANPDHDSRPGFWTWEKDAEVFIKLMEYGRVTVDSLVTEEVAARNLIPAYNRMLKGSAEMIGTLINWCA